VGVMQAQQDGAAATTWVAELIARPALPAKAV
jgi:hypothetical protein